MSCILDTGQTWTQKIGCSGVDSVVQTHQGGPSWSHVGYQIID